MFAASISAKTASGKTLETLAALIKKRSEITRKDTADSCVATVINALVSLRAGTRTAKKPAKTDVTLRTDLVPSFSSDGGTVHRCLRTGSARNSPRFDSPFAIYWLDRSIDFKRAKVFFLKSMHERLRPCFCVAYSKAQALAFINDRARKNIAEMSGLAKTTLGVAMAKISTRNDGKTDKKTVAALSSKLAEVRKNFSADSFSLYIHDQLNYAVPALKKNMTVDIALMKAANRTAGIINNYIRRHPNLEEQLLPSPFPEVKGHR